jgi:pimeloyl-ACP methyl ester carboxylesterase
MSGKQPKRMRRASVLLAALGNLLTLASSPHAQPTQATAPEVELRRRAMFGAQLADVTKEVRDRQKLDGNGGIMLEQVFPGTSAADAELKAGDVILAIGGGTLIGVPMFLESLAKARAGDVLTLDVVRDGVRREWRVTLKEMPRENGDGYDVIYGAVTSHGARLRTIVTRPKGEGRHPAVMLLQGGHTCFAIDTPVGQPTSFTWLARDLTRHGYVTLRVERPGCGDSQGGPLRDVDFDTELEGYKQALRALKHFDFVDADNVFLFGHSMGGNMAPLMAVEVPVRGIAVYGTGAGTWFEAAFEQPRRLASLDGTNPAEVDREILGQARFWYPLLVERKTPREILEQNPELRKLGWVTDDKYVGDRHYTFHHQIADNNLTEAWSKVAARVLTMWGTSDWLVDRAGNAWIAEVINRTKPGNGRFVALDSIDHFFFRAASPEESYQIWKPAPGAPPRELNTVFLETLRAWLDETAGKAKKELQNPANENNPGTSR